MFNYRQHAVALALCLCASVASAQDFALLRWNPSTTNTDGTPLTDLFGYRVSWGSAAGNYPNSLTLPGALSSYQVEPLAPGTWYFVVSAINTAGAESAVSNVASKTLVGVLLVPGPVINPDVVVATVPTMTISMVAAPENPTWNEWFLTISAAGSVVISANGTTRFDWVRQGAATGGGGGTVVPTIPAIDGDGGVLSQAITVNGPISGARADLDGAAFSGAQVTVNGVMKPLVLAGSTWSVSFP